MSNISIFFLGLFKKFICDDSLVQPNMLTIKLGQFGFNIKDMDFTFNPTHLALSRLGNEFD
jgi:hypothetical protein